ncbi:MAG TPA: hypothetical protein VK698_10710 [Kofleriaceae bacterium]|nr:hypothetical protein [Kofleriaceae bacterium]
MRSCGAQHSIHQLQLLERLERDAPIGKRARLNGPVGGDREDVVAGAAVGPREQVRQIGELRMPADVEQDRRAVALELDERRAKRGEVRVVEEQRAVRALVAEEQDVPGSERDELANARGDVVDVRGRHEPVHADRTLGGCIDAIERASPVVVGIDRQPVLADLAAQSVDELARQEHAVRRDVEAELRGRVQLLDELGEALEQERLAASECDFQNAPAIRALEQIDEEWLVEPARRLAVAIAEAAREIARREQADLQAPRCVATERGRRRARIEEVRATRAIESCDPTIQLGPAHRP